MSVPLAMPPKRGPAPQSASPRPAPLAAPAGLIGSRLAPPFALPASHFVGALVFWVVGALMLTWAAPDLARGAFVSPRVVALTHLFTLGWITLTIQGALYQFLPVALGAPIRSQRLAYAGLVLHVPGLAVFAAGLLSHRTALTIAGAATFSVALLLFVANLCLTLWHARAGDDSMDASARRLTWWTLAGATVFLAATVVLGVTLSGNLRLGYLGADRFAMVGVHFHVAMVGWVMLVVVGVAHRLLPMFLLSHGAPEWPGAAAGVLMGGGTALLLVLHRSLEGWTVWAIAAAIAAGVLAFLVQAFLFFRHRRKPALDPGLRLAASGVGFLVASMVLAGFALAAGLQATHMWTAYGLTAVLGGLSLFVAGHYYKIFPFLVWFHRFGPLAGKRPVPRVADLYADAPAGLATVLLVGGVVGLGAAALLRAEPLARPAALSFAAGALIVASQMWTISRRRPQ